MKLFLDTAHIEGIKLWAATGLIDGVTTNPTHLSKEIGLAQEIIKTICQTLPEGDISVEVTEKEPRVVYEQAKRIAELAPNIIVKIPCSKEYVPIINKLVSEDILLNITLVFSVTQALLMAKLGVTYVSPFIGRIDDIDGDGSMLVREIVEVLEIYDYETQVLAASIRTVRQAHQAMLDGVHALTVPFEILEKMIKHPLSEQGMEKFLSDWQKLGIKQFP